MNPPQHILLFATRVYRLTISPAQVFLFGPTGGCRFTPTCSQYAMEAIRAHGALAGGWLAVKRICHCHPWGDGGHDPVPQNETILPPLLSKRGEGWGEESNRFQISSPRTSWERRRPAGQSGAENQNSPARRQRSQELRPDSGVQSANLFGEFSLRPSPRLGGARGRALLKPTR